MYNTMVDAFIYSNPILVVKLVVEAGNRQWIFFTNDLGLLYAQSLVKHL
ncbi:MAG: hypothetical protein HC862_04350 [Scytonema sp. RU_4_4]|nr:hypothetical protein [Scytonema sp. RU_4_4]